MQSKIFIIAGEESGDNIGAKLIKQIKTHKPDCQIKGVGGTRMTSEGLTSLFPMHEISLMGFLEIIPHLPNLIKRINQTVQDIIDFNPDYVVTIDSPGFNYQIAKKLKKKNFQGKLIHYVAPTVWAYKEKRAKKTAKLFDKLLCILPWEPPYFEKEGLDAKFVGHPIFENMNFLDVAGKKAEKKNYLIGKDDIVISCLIGSRAGEVKHLASIYADALKILERKLKKIKIFILATDSMKTLLQDRLSKFPKNTAIITEDEEKQKLLQISDAAIVKSGTVGLEVASYKTPHVICYKVNPISYRIIKTMIKTEFVNLVNISAGKQIIKELIQDESDAEKIAREVVKLVKDKEYAKTQINDAQTELKKMGLKSKNLPSKIAMNEIFDT